MDLERILPLLDKAESLDLRYVWEVKTPADGSEGYCEAIGWGFEAPPADSEVSEHFWTLYGRDAGGLAFAIFDESDPVVMLGKLAVALEFHDLLAAELTQDLGYQGLLLHARKHLRAEVEAAAEQ